MILLFFIGFIKELFDLVSIYFSNDWNVVVVSARSPFLVPPTVALKPTPDEIELDPGQQLFVVGDLHGDLEAFEQALLLGNLIDGPNGRWSGNQSILIQCGDVLDSQCRQNKRACKRVLRGPPDSEFRIVHRLVDLMQQARAAGGDVIMLLGNHEVLNLQGNLKYVSSHTYAAFNGTDRKRQRRKLMREWAPFYSRFGRVIQRVGPLLVSHAGPLPAHRRFQIQDLNMHVSRSILQNRPIDELVADLFWHRDYGYGDRQLPETCSDLQRTLDWFGAKFLAIGHSPQRVGVTVDCDRSLYRTDVGLSASIYGKRIEILHYKQGDDRPFILKKDDDHSYNNTIIKTEL